MDVYRARTEDVVVDELDGGLVVYDAREGRANWLEGPDATVWRACAPGATVAQIAQVCGLEEAGCVEALGRLVDAGLVEVEGGLSRRAALGTAARIGAVGVVGAPIVSVLIPVAAAHASSGGSQTPTNPPPPQTVTTTYTSNTSITLAARQTLTYTLTGGGGGGTAEPFAFGDGGAGGSITGTITNKTGSSQTLEIVIGHGGTLGNPGAPGGSGYQSGGAGAGAGGGGGGSSAIVDQANGQFLVIAGGGGGGMLFDGRNGGQTTGMTSEGPGTDAAGGVGGGGGGGNGGQGGEVDVYADILRSTGGSNDYHPNDPAFTVTVTSSGASAGPSGAGGSYGARSGPAGDGADGSATVTTTS